MDARGHVSSVCTLDHLTCAPSSYRAFLGGKAQYFQNEFSFSLVFRIFLGLQHPCATTNSRCLTRVNVRRQQQLSRPSGGWGRRFTTRRYIPYRVCTRTLVLDARVLECKYLKRTTHTHVHYPRSGGVRSVRIQGTTWHFEIE